MKRSFYLGEDAWVVRRAINQPYVHHQAGTNNKQPVDSLILEPRELTPRVWLQLSLVLV